MERSVETKNRAKNVTKPVYQPFTERLTKKSTPTITSNGPTGSKIFVSIALPKDPLVNSHLTKLNQKRQHHGVKQNPPEPTPLELQKLLLEVSRAQTKGRQDHNTVDGIVRSVKLAPNRSDILRGSGRSVRRVSTDKPPTPAQPNTSPAHLNVSIPSAAHISGPVSTVSYSYTDDSVSRSCDLDDVRSDISETPLSPLPPTPVPQQEGTEAMRHRVHQGLLKTLSDTDQFLRAMEQKRSNRPPQIVYSDDEEMLPETERSGPLADSMSAGGREVTLQIEPNTPREDHADLAFSDELSGSQLSVSTTISQMTASQQYFQLVRHLETDPSFINECRVDSELLNSVKNNTAQ